jgi:hypothetical protein
MPRRPDPTPPPPDRNPRRLSDEDILERADRAYEYGAWAADMGMVDFDAFAELGDVLREMRARSAAGGAS